jgi:hypothetical protein
MGPADRSNVEPCGAEYSSKHQHVSDMAQGQTQTVGVAQVAWE